MRVVAAAAQGRADWGIAIATVAELYATAFLPISPERYDFLVAESRCSRPAVQAFPALAAPDVRERIAAFGMKFDIKAAGSATRQSGRAAGLGLLIVEPRLMSAGDNVRP